MFPLKWVTQKKRILVCGVAKASSKDTSSHENIFKLGGRKFEYFVLVLQLLKNGSFSTV